MVPNMLAIWLWWFWLYNSYFDVYMVPNMLAIWPWWCWLYKSYDVYIVLITMFIMALTKMSIWLWIYWLYGSDIISVCIHDILYVYMALIMLVIWLCTLVITLTMMSLYSSGKDGYMTHYNVYASDCDVYMTLIMLAILLRLQCPYGSVDYLLYWLLYVSLYIIYFELLSWSDNNFNHIEFFVMNLSEYGKWYSANRIVSKLM